MVNPCSIETTNDSWSTSCAKYPSRQDCELTSHIWETLVILAALPSAPLIPGLSWNRVLRVHGILTGSMLEYFQTMALAQRIPLIPYDSRIQGR